MAKIETHGATTGNKADQPTPPRATPLDYLTGFLKGKMPTGSATGSKDEDEMLKATETEDEKKNK